MARPAFTVPYDPFFLGDGFEVPLPSLVGRAARDAYEDGAPIDYIHYSLSMNAARRVAAYTAHNIDAAQMVKMSRKGIPWELDERVPAEIQLGPEVYSSNAWDRGHLVRREDVLWGPVSRARAANRATFFYTNAAPQHENFNQDEWVALENWVLHRAPEFSYRLCVFTGPVLADDDRTLGQGDPSLRAAFRNWQEDVLIPAAFWKVIVLRDETAAGDDLSVVAFAMRQSDLWTDKDGPSLVRLKTYQVTLGQIEQWTDLDFGDLKLSDELNWPDRLARARTLTTESPYPMINSEEDIVFSGAERRRRAGRVERRAPGRSALRLDRRGESNCGCIGATDKAAAADKVAAVDARIEDLSLRFEMLVDMLTSERGPGRMAAPDAPVTEIARPGRISEEDWERLQNAMAASKLGRGGIEEAKQIVGGNRAYRGQFPSCVGLGNGTGWFCTGVLIRPRVVLTAAHCGASISKVLIDGTRMPTATVGSDGKVVMVSRVVPRVSRNWRTTRDWSNDITVIVLDTPATAVADVEPVALATDAELAAAAEVTLVGFGYADPRASVGFGTLREVTVARGPVKVDNEDYSDLERLLGYDAETEFVAGRKRLGRDSCRGDSGGPAYIEVDGTHKLAGLTSRSTHEAERLCGDGGIYVRPWRHREWIDGVLRDLGIGQDD